MNLAFAIYRYFPHGGLQQDLEKIVCECIARGHKVTVFAGEWQGAGIPYADIEIIRPRGFTGCEKLASFEQKAFLKLSKGKFDAVTGFMPMRGLDVYFAGNDSFPAEPPKRTFWARLLSPHYCIEQKLEQEVFAPASKTKILYLTESQKREFIRIYNTQEERFHLLPPGISERYVKKSGRSSGSPEISFSCSRSRLILQIRAWTGRFRHLPPCPIRSTGSAAS